MGWALAKAFKSFGAHPFLICGPPISPPASLPAVRVISARRMYQEAKKRFAGSDIFVSCAAVSDYRPQKKYLKKIHKGKKNLQVRFLKNPDILQLLAKKKKKQFCIGFALEDAHGERNAERKMAEKNCDLMVLNSPSTMGSDFIRPTILLPGQAPFRLKRMSKVRFAKKLCQIIGKLL